MNVLAYIALGGIIIAALLVFILSILPDDFIERFIGDEDEDA